VLLERQARQVQWMQETHARQAACNAHQVKSTARVTAQQPLLCPGKPVPQVQRRLSSTPQVSPLLLVLSHSTAAVRHLGLAITIRPCESLAPACLRRQG
jgi:hypothetical protein